MAHKDQETLAENLSAGASDLDAPRCALVIYHRDLSYLVPLNESAPTILGRDASADIRLQDRSLSRQHASFSVEGAEVLVEDLGSTNGTHKNGAALQGRERLSPTDELRLGSVTVALHVLSAPGSRPLGLDPHEQWTEALTQEALRSRFFSRKFAVIVVRSADPDLHVRRWASRVRELLRPVDRVAMYSGNTVELLLPEIEPEALRALGQSIVDAKEEPALLAGLALYPSAATTAQSLLEVARSAARRARPAQPLVAQLKHRAVASKAEGDAPIVESPRMLRVYQMISRVAPTKMPILINGETGSGKEIVARAIHQRSKLKDSPLVAVNCGAIPPQLISSTLFGHVAGAFSGAVGAPGLFENAHGGTVFLDEVGELPAEAQAALLRVLEGGRMTRVGSSKEIQVTVRVLAATHRDLETMVKEGEFREDLYYRLVRFKVEVPPLRERPEDIEPLVRRFLDQAAVENELPPVRIESDALAMLMAYSWPGNIRELKNVIDRAAIIATEDCITIEELPSKLRQSASSPSALGVDASSESVQVESMTSEATTESEFGDGLDLKVQLKHFESKLILDALNATQGNQTEAARRLNMPLRTLVRRISSLGIRRQGYGVE